MDEANEQLAMDGGQDDTSPNTGGETTPWLGLERCLALRQSSQGQQPSWLMLEGASSPEAGCRTARQRAQPGLEPPAGWPLPQQLVQGALGVATMAAAATHPSSAKRKEEDGPGLSSMLGRDRPNFLGLSIFFFQKKKNIFFKSWYFSKVVLKNCHFSK